MSEVTVSVSRGVLSTVQAALCPFSKKMLSVQVLTKQKSYPTSTYFEVMIVSVDRTKHPYF